jgi:transposase
MSKTNSVKIIIGVDTHKDIQAAVAIKEIGARLGTLTIPVRPKGYWDLEIWARAFGAIHALGIEGTGSYGAGLSRFLQAKGHSVVEVNRPNRQLRHHNGKSDSLDAENAARAVLGGQANARPKSADSSVEMIRHLKVARDTAVKSRTQAMITLKTIIINAPCARRSTASSVRWR